MTVKDSSRQSNSVRMWRVRGLALITLSLLDRGEATAYAVTTATLAKKESLFSVFTTWECYV